MQEGFICSECGLNLQPLVLKGCAVCGGLAHLVCATRSGRYDADKNEYYCILHKDLHLYVNKRRPRARVSTMSDNESENSFLNLSPIFDDSKDLPAPTFAGGENSSNQKSPADATPPATSTKHVQIANTPTNIQSTIQTPSTGASSSTSDLQVEITEEEIIPANVETLADNTQNTQEKNPETEKEYAMEYRRMKLQAEELSQALAAQTKDKERQSQEFQKQQKIIKTKVTDILERQKRHHEKALAAREKVVRAEMEELYLSLEITGKQKEPSRKSKTDKQKVDNTTNQVRAAAKSTINAPSNSQHYQMLSSNNTNTFTDPRQTNCGICKLIISPTNNRVLSCNVCKILFHLECTKTKLPAFSPTYVCDKCNPPKSTSAQNPVASSSKNTSATKGSSHNNPNSKGKKNQKEQPPQKEPEGNNADDDEESSEEDSESDEDSFDDDNNSNDDSDDENKDREEPQIPTARQEPSNFERMIAQMCETNNQALLRQIRNDERNQTKELPIVQHLGAEWLVFYKAYEKSKDKFDPQENVVRLQKAIQCDEIKKQGGTNLFSPATYEITIQELHLRLNNPREMLLKNVKKILAMKNPKEHPNDHKKLIDFITEIRHLGNLQQELGQAASQTDRHHIVAIVNMIPVKYITSWLELCAKKDLEGTNISFTMLGKCLYKKVPIIQQLLYNEEFYKGLGEASSKKPAANSQGEKHKDNNQYNDNHKLPIKFPLNNISTQEEPHKKPFEFKCWIDCSDDHSFRECQKGKLMSGQETYELARKMKICMNCGREPYSGTCKIRDLPTPCRVHPEQRHWWLYCPSRQAAENYRKPVYKDSRTFEQSNNQNYHSPTQNSYNNTNAIQNQPPPVEENTDRTVCLMNNNTQESQPQQSNSNQEESNFYLYQPFNNYNVNTRRSYAIFPAPIQEINADSPRALKSAYRNESNTVIERPATAVAAINSNAKI